MLHADDPWWRTNYPPNGWRCGCYVDALSRRDLERLGKSGPDKAPALKRHTVTVGTRGPSPRTVSVPEGVDPGFAYVPGRESLAGEAAQQRLLQGITQEPHLAASGVRGILDTPRIMAAHEEAWNAWRQQGAPRGSQAETFVLTAMDQTTQSWLAAHKRLIIASAAVTITRRELGHAGRADKVKRQQALDEADWVRLPTIMHEPDAILYDSTKNNLVYVFTPVSDARTGKVAIEINLSDRLKRKDRERERITTNSVRTSGYVQANNLRGSSYELISGEIE